MDGVVKARLVKQCGLDTTAASISGLSNDGKKNIEVASNSHVFRGNPLLLEVTATKTTAESAFFPDVRQELAGQTEELVALLTWSLQGVVGTMLGDELCSIPVCGSPEWALDITTTIALTDFFRDIASVASRVADTERALQKYANGRRSTVATAMRWWRHAQQTHSPLDRFLAHCIIIEVASAEINADRSTSISKGIEKTVGTVFPALGQADDGKRITKMRNALYSARSKCVHSGLGDCSRDSPVFQITAATAHACIRFLVDGSVSEPPEHVLRLLGI
jgi:hypothetical protein